MRLKISHPCNHIAVVGGSQAASVHKWQRDHTPLEYKTGTETILLVEDEEPLRKVVVELLSQLGYKVLSAGNAKEALGLATDAQQIDLLITDVLMPEISGPELARQLQT